MIRRIVAHDMQTHSFLKTLFLSYAEHKFAAREGMTHYEPSGELSNRHYGQTLGAMKPSGHGKYPSMVYSD